MLKRAWIATAIAVLAAGCVATPENGDDITNPASITANGWVFGPGEAVAAQVWHPGAEAWQSLQSTTSSATPGLVRDTEKLYSWQMSLNLGSGALWTGPGAFGEARIRFVLPGTSYSLISFDQGGYGCAASAVVGGEYPSVAGVDCASDTSPAINLLRHQGLTTVYLVRHAEKESETLDPPLSAAGLARAQDLSDELTYAPLSAIITSTFLRTRQTAEPTAQRTGLVPIQLGATAYAQMAQMITQSFAGGRVLVVGHSDTIGAIIAQLGVPASSTPGILNGFADLYVVHIPTGPTTPTIAHRTYGAPSL